MSLTRPRHKADLNQARIVSALREIGASVEILAAAGHGCPDLLVGYAGANYLLEVKSKKGKLTPDQERWHGFWRGQVGVVRTIGEALDVLKVKW